MLESVKFNVQYTILMIWVNWFSVNMKWDTHTWLDHFHFELVTSKIVQFINNNNKCSCLCVCLSIVLCWLSWVDRSWQLNSHSQFKFTISGNALRNQWKIRYLLYTFKLADVQSNAMQCNAMQWYHGERWLTL